MDIQNLKGLAEVDIQTVSYCLDLKDLKHIVP